MIGNHNVCKELFKWSAWNAKLMYVHVLNIYENDNKTLSNPFTMYSVLDILAHVLISFIYYSSKLEQEYC